MSQLENARNMDEPSWMGDSSKKVRERVGTSTPREVPLYNSDRSPVTRRPQATGGVQTRDGDIGVAISRPIPVPQWPLVGPIALPSAADTEPYRPPPGRSQPPQRPPRPSRVPSILDSSRVQDPTPSFRHHPQAVRASEVSTLDTPATHSRPSTFSSVGSIPDFPLPVAAPLASSRRSLNLGPPPSSRRGASSFYSASSFVSPIPEENTRLRSHTSYASSAAIPETFGSMSPSSQNDPYYMDDIIAEESFVSDDADDSQLVRSASIGKRGKPSLITTKGTDKSNATPSRPTLAHVQGDPFSDGTGYIEASSSSSVQATVKNADASGLTADTMLYAFQTASATDPSSVSRTGARTRSFRLSGLRRPLRLDMDAVARAEARGSLTSLPDLIRRATRLVTLMDKGQRPASRLDDLDIPGELYNKDSENSSELEKHQSGLSDMLAAFPPPGSRRTMRQSMLSWPLPRQPSRGPTVVSEQAIQTGRSGPYKSKARRRCCGLPLWGFMLLLFLIIAIIVVAIVVPIKILVLNKNRSPGLDCSSQLPCANGGTSVLSQGVCSCICSNGFTGKDCTTRTTQGCTSTTLETASATRIDNVTIGQAIPGLILEAQSNFSVPLSATSIISRFSRAELSCNAQNALVTFDGLSLSRHGVGPDRDGSALVAIRPAWDQLGDGITLTLVPGIDATVMFSQSFWASHISMTTVKTATTSRAWQNVYPTDEPSSSSPVSTAVTTPTTSTNDEPSSSSSVPSTTMPTTPTTPTTASEPTSTQAGPSNTSKMQQPTKAFRTIDEVVDFARITVLYILQEKSVEQASSAQSALQHFFNVAGSYLEPGEGRNITIGNGNSVDLVNFFVDVGAGRVGGSRNT
ncbi:hypothetical protein GGS20DRAFT_198141 [Poronia punctata]|nr:hypothetical protein GGS20DRAFT_198141 [Poronia punctata]